MSSPGGGSERDPKRMGHKTFFHRFSGLSQILKGKSARLISGLRRNLRKPAESVDEFLDRWARGPLTPDPSPAAGRGESGNRAMRERVERKS